MTDAYVHGYTSAEQERLLAGTGAGAGRPPTQNSAYSVAASGES
jgi:hypothetical protein